MKHRELADLKARIEAIRREIGGLGEIRPGSLSQQYNVCGNPTCRCKAPKNPQKHGPYYQLGYLWKGRHTTEFVKEEDVVVVKEQIGNGQRLRELVAEWFEVSAEMARLRRETAKAEREGRKEEASA